MFKKIFVIGAALAFALGMGATAQAAGIAGTAHEQAASGGACAACHLPHGAQGARLWVAAPAIGQANVKGFIAPLCGYCHHKDGGQKAFGDDATSFTWVFGTNSHGVLMSATTAPRSTYFSGLPYHVSGTDPIGKIQCSTCHDVHNDDIGKRPFLRANINILCATCHGLRQWNGTAWQQGNFSTIGTLQAWGVATYLQKNNPGSHPIGTDITGNVVADAPITIWRSMKVGFAGSRMKWSLGGHLSAGNTGGMSCLTCHAIHGIKSDGATGNGVAANAFPTDATTPFPNMLAISQGSALTDNGRTVANGGGGRNALCEGCHWGNTTALASPYQVANAASVQGHINPNPGATPYSHPVDTMRIQDNWVADGATWPTSNLNWPVGGASGASISNPNVICESCHVAHPNANSGRADLAVAPGRATSNQYILRSKAADVCWACHTDSLKEHHPVGKRYNTQGVPYLSGVKASAMDTLECGSCHSGQGAHNWSGRGYVGLDNNWRPYNNGRFAAAATEVFDTVASLTCMDCHGSMLGGALKSNRSPTLHANFDTQYAPPTLNGAPGTATGEYYGFIGYGSHAMGRLGAGTNYIRQSYSQAGYWASLNAKVGNLFNTASVPTWTAAGFGGQGGWSRFGGTSANPVLVCESCHELQPTKNSTTHLLLGYFAEEPGPGVASSRSNFCDGCHRPAGTHQQSSETVSKTNALLSTAINTTTRPWLVNPTDTVNIVLSNNNRLNCDSCHQVHDANTNSATFILDVRATDVGAMTALRAANAGVWGSYSGFWPTIQSGKGGDFTAFCKQCHNY